MKHTSPYLILSYLTVADPGFPVGGSVDLRRGRFSAKMCAKTKESGPVGGACAGHAPPRSANALFTKIMVL